MRPTVTRVCYTVETIEKPHYYVTADDRWSVHISRAARFVTESDAQLISKITLRKTRVVEHMFLKGGNTLLY